MLAARDKMNSLVDRTGMWRERESTSSNRSFNLVAGGRRAEGVDLKKRIPKRGPLTAREWREQCWRAGGVRGRVRFRPDFVSGNWDMHFDIKQNMEKRQRRADAECRALCRECGSGGLSDKSCC